MVCQERRIAFGSPSFFVTFGSFRRYPKFYKMELDRSNVYRMICKEL